MARRYADDYEETYVSPRNAGHGRSGGRYVEEDVDIRRSSRAPGRETTVRERDELRVRDSGPAFLQDDYNRPTAGALVLRKRETEDFEYAPRPRRRSPSPERRVEREEIIIRGKSRSPSPRRSIAPPRSEHERDEIIIRRDERDSRGPGPRRSDVERDEVIIRRDELEDTRRGTRHDAVSYEDLYRQRSLSPGGYGGETSREEIIIRKDERKDDRRPTFRPREEERDEIIIRRSEQDDRGPRNRPREESVREEIIIRKDDREDDRRPISRPPQEASRSREEIIIRRTSDDDIRSRVSGRAQRRENGYELSRRVSHERQRSPSRIRGGRHRSGSVSEDEIVIRRDKVDGGRGRGGSREREEIIIRHKSASRSPSPSIAPSLSVAPPIVNAPTIHQEVITHHRHIDHGYTVQQDRPRYSRPPSPPSPPPAERHDDERIEILRSGERSNGERYREDIIIDRNEGGRHSAPPYQDRGGYNSNSRPHGTYRDPNPNEFDPRPTLGPLVPLRPSGYGHGYARDEDVAEEAQYYNDIALERGYPGEAYRGATRDWGLVDVPPGTRKVRMDGAGGGAQEVSWQRYNGSRRSKFMPDADEGYGTASGGSGGGDPYASRNFEPSAAQLERYDARQVAQGGEVARRYDRTRDPTEGLWTEVTKDLVSREAIREMGYEFEETEKFYYIIAFLRVEDMQRLVGLSDEISRARRDRVKEMEWERKYRFEGSDRDRDRDRLPIRERDRDRDRDRYLPERSRTPLLLESSSRAEAREREHDHDHASARSFDRDEERLIEREITYGPRPGRGPPPMGPGGYGPPPPGYGRDPHGGGGSGRYGGPPPIW